MVMTSQLVIPPSIAPAVSDHTGIVSQIFTQKAPKEFLGLLPGDDAICQVLLIVRIKELIYTTRAGRLPSSFWNIAICTKVIHWTAS